MRPLDPALDAAVARARALRQPESPALLVAAATPDNLPGLVLPARVPQRGALLRDGLAYLTAQEYVPDYLSSKGLTDGVPEWTNELLAAAPRDDLIRTLTAALNVADAGGVEGVHKQKQWAEHVFGAVEPALADALIAALSDPSKPRVLLARQPLLLALRQVLARSAKGRSSARLDLPTVVTLLSHAAAPDHHRSAHSEPLLGGLPESLAMEYIQNSYFNAEHDFGNALARFRLIWTEYEQRLVRYKPRIPLKDLVLESTGVDLDDILTIGFALYAQAVQADVVNGPRQTDLSQLRLPQAAVDAFLARFSYEADDFARETAGMSGDWQLLPFEARPVLRLGRHHAAVLDVRLLELRLTAGLYWLIHDHERDVTGGSARMKWTQTYSELMELYVEDLFGRMAPPLLDGKSTVFTEEALRPLGGRTADLGVDFGSAVLLADVIQHQLTLEARNDGNIDAYKKDVEKSIVGKAVQVSDTIDVLRSRASHPKNPLGRMPERLLPMVIQGAAFPITPVTVTHARQRVAEEGALQQSGVAELLIANVSELEMLEGLHAADVAGVAETLEGWLSDEPTVALRNYMIRRHGRALPGRSPALQAALDNQFKIVERKLAKLGQ